MKLIQITLLCSLLIFTACSKPTCTPVVTVKEVKVPVYPDIPEIDCSFEGEGLEPIDKLIECISYQKHILDLIRAKRQEQIK